MHHDSRTYIELRFDTNSTDVCIVAFRDRGILPIEVMTLEYTLDAPEFTGNPLAELKAILFSLQEELRKA
jgi:hypothetical protein